LGDLQRENEALFFFLFFRRCVRWTSAHWNPVAPLARKLNRARCFFASIFALAIVTAGSANS